MCLSLCAATLLRYKQLGGDHGIDCRHCSSSSPLCSGTPPSRTSTRCLGSRRSRRWTGCRRRRRTSISGCACGAYWVLRSFRLSEQKKHFRLQKVFLLFGLRVVRLLLRQRIWHVDHPRESQSRSRTSNRSCTTSLARSCIDDKASYMAEILHGVLGILVVVEQQRLVDDRVQQSVAQFLSGRPRDERACP